MEGSGSVQIMADLDPEGPKAYGSYGSGSNTLAMTMKTQLPRSRSSFSKKLVSGMDAMDLIFWTGNTDNKSHRTPQVSIQTNILYIVSLPCDNHQP
jgi:hypothetical protein